MTKLKIGFVGFGNQATGQHARYLVEKCSESVEIVAICDILYSDRAFVDRHLKQLGLWSTAVYSIDRDDELNPANIQSLEKLLEAHTDLDAMIITTPNAKHYYQVKACLEKKLHVLVDKPLALTYQQGKQLVNLANQPNGPYLVVSSQRRYESAYRYAKKVIESNELGKIISIDGIISHSADRLHNWRRDPVLAGGGVLWSQGWHTIDTIVYLINKKALAVDAFLYYPEGTEVETYVSSLIHFDGDLAVTFTANFGAPSNAVFERLHIWGTKGNIIIERFKPIYDDLQPTVTHQMSDGRVLKPMLTEMIAKKWGPTEAFVNLLSALQGPALASKQANISLVSTGLESLETLRIIETVYSSAQQGVRITLTTQTPKGCLEHP